MKSIRPLPIRRRSCVMAAASVMLALGLPAQAEGDFPTKPIRIIVPFSAGGPTDAATRLLAKEMQATLGQPVIIDNKPGAAGALGIDVVAKSPPDGYTLGISGVGPTILLAAMDPKLPYKPLTDLAFIGNTGTTELMFVVGNQVPAKNMKELLQIARDKPGKLTYASAGQGGPVHVSFEYLKTLARVDLVHVPYKGDPPALQDLMGGQVDVGLISPTVALQQIKAGRIKPIASAGTVRSKLTPDLPTASESGLPGYESNVFTLLVAPAGTPAPVVDKLSHALNAALALPSVQEQYAAMGMAPNPMTPAKTREFVQGESAKWTQVIHTAKVTRDQ